MKIVSYMHPMRLFILDNGDSIPVDAYPELMVGQTLEYKDGTYTLANSAEGCAT